MESSASRFLKRGSLATTVVRSAGFLGRTRGKFGVALVLATIIAFVLLHLVSNGSRSVVDCAERSSAVETTRQEPTRVDSMSGAGASVNAVHSTSEGHDSGHAYATLKSAFETFEITKVKDIEFGTDPEAFFMSVLPLNGTLFASYRTTLSSWHTKVVKMDGDFTPSASEKVIEIPNTEDARVIELNGEGWLIDNHFLQPRAMTSLDGRRRVVLNTTKLGENFDRGKNWAPFVHQSRLFFVYSLSPLRILECDMPDGILHWVYRSSEAGDEMGLADMLKRGGTNGVVHQNYVYGVARETVYQNIVCSGSQHSNVAQHYPFLWRFHISLLDSGASRALNQAQIGSVEFRKLIHPFDRGVNDPASLFAHDSSLYVTISSCACACLPEFRAGNEWHRNSVYKLLLRQE